MNKCNLDGVCHNQDTEKNCMSSKACIFKYNGPVREELWRDKTEKKDGDER